jgi:hypothetical protein
MNWRALLDKPAVQAVQKHWLSLAFVLGFVSDLILLNQIDSLFDNLLLAFYVTLATVSLLLFYAGVAQRGGERVAPFLERYMPVLMQYSFGGLLSGMLIFYGRSGDFFVSAPFFILIVAVVFGNEFIKKRSNRLLFHLALYFIGTFAYLVMLVPLLTGMMGEVIFVGSGLLALALMVLVVKLLLRIIPNFVTMQIRSIVMVIGSIFVLFNGLYFFNVIPPIPLSLTELHIYHSVEPTPAGGYRVQTTNEAWWQQLPYIPFTFSPAPGKGAYCFARVYTPTRLQTDIVHVWDYYDPNRGWVEQFRLAYPITGENKRGYGGYTNKITIFNGKWRCSVETERGQVLGRRTFTIDVTGDPGRLITRVE